MSKPGSATTIAVAEVHAPEGSPTILVTKRMEGTRWLDLLLSTGARVVILDDNDHLPLTPAQLQSALDEHKPVAVLVQCNEPWRREILALAAGLGVRVIATNAVGYDNIDVAAATKLGIRVGNSPGALTAATAECAVALTFAAARRVVELDTFVRTRQFRAWHPRMGLGVAVEGATVGVFGAGRIGGAYARRMAALGCSIVYLARDHKPELESYVRDLSEFRVARGESPISVRRAVDLHDLLAASDILSIHSPLTPQTRGLFNAERLAEMKPGSLLVNTARGPIVVEEALAAALRNGPLAAAGLDVFEREPEVHPALFELPNVVMLPHVGSANFPSREAMSLLAAANIIGMLQGYPVAKRIEDVLDGFRGGPPYPQVIPSAIGE